MSKFFLGAGIMYAIAGLYFCALLSQPGVISPAGAAPIAAMAWPVSMARVFWADLKPMDCRPKTEERRP